jgi:hypothetical protein
MAIPSIIEEHFSPKVPSVNNDSLSLSYYIYTYCRKPHADRDGWSADIYPDGGSLHLHIVSTFAKLEY